MSRPPADRDPFLQEDEPEKEDAMKRHATAQWRGDLKSGKGWLATESGVLSETPYSFTTRFEGEKGTNPEELVAAAHAGCFTMALSAELGKASLVAESLRTKATVALEKEEGGWSVTESHLELVAKIPGASAQAFRTAAESAKANCPLSRLLKAKITLDAKLEEETRR
jgi:lipoyl-dependent peroxiredoxin